MNTTFKFDIFKEIMIGGLTKEQLLQKLTEYGIQFNKYADTLFDHPQFLPTAKTEKVKLVKISPSVFDLHNSFSFKELVNRASKAGLKICPLYLAAFLRLEYLDQPEGPYLTIAAEKPDLGENYPNGFYIRKNDGVLWLRGYRADDLCDWPEPNEFIFLK